MIHIHSRTHSSNAQSAPHRCVGVIRTTGWTGVVLALCLTSVTVANEQSAPPNIVFVLADDLGWAELGCYGNDFHDTPNIDGLAADGLRFTRAYAAAPVCSPYRAALLTGQHPARLGLTDYLRPNSANALSTELTTFPKVLRDSGYATGMIGKWHLTGYRHHGAVHEVRPRDHGFEWNIASEVKGVGNGANFWPYVFRTQPISWIDLESNRLGDSEFLVDRMNLEAVDFIERNADKPFFLYLSHFAPHSIVNGRPDLVDKYRARHVPGPSSRSRCYLCEDQGRNGDELNHWASDHNPHLAAMIESIDDGVGQIIQTLKENNLYRNTIFVFTSDNGGETNITTNGRLRGGKSQLYEGGVRIPLIISWPARVSAGRVCDQPTCNFDFYPTLLEAAGCGLPANHRLDGISILPQLSDPETKINREALFWHYPLDRPHFLGGRSGGSVLSQNWKLIEYFDSAEQELFNLSEDPSEQVNVINENPNQATRLSQMLTRWRDDVSARLPAPPLLSEPGQLSFADHFSPEQISTRWFFNEDWTVEEGILRKTDSKNSASRVFLRDTEFQNAIVRFDFQLQSCRDLRLVTGSNGPYNAVIHIRPDHFYVQTAKDDSVPCFSYRHGECAFEFAPERWYTMTVEFTDNRLLARIDHEHLAFAEHVILKKPRTYFAFQADQNSAAIDNVQILTAKPHKNQEESLKEVARLSARFPVSRPLQEQISIRKSNLHELYFQTRPEYRDLVETIDQLDAERKELFPKAFRTHKEVHKKIGQERRELLEKDPQYKELLFATYRAQRAIDEYLIGMNPKVAELSFSRQKHFLSLLREKHSQDPDLLKLERVLAAAGRKLRSAYPQLFVTDAEITKTREENRRQVEQSPQFKDINHRRAEAWRAQENYLMTNDADLKRLYEKLRDSSGK